VNGQTLYGYALVAVALLVVAGIVVAAWRGRDRDDLNGARAAAQSLDLAGGDPMPAASRAWIVDGARVRHDVLGLGRVDDLFVFAAPTTVVVRFDTLSEPRPVRVHELDPVTVDDERLRSVDGEQRGVWPRACGLDSSCYWHGDGCGRASTWTREVAFCCASCPARGGAL